MEEQKKRGGARPNAGRKSVAEEQKVNNIMISALKEFYKKDTDDDAKKELVKTLLDSQRGQIFVSEHIFGKAKERVENVNINIEQEDLTKSEIELIKESLKDAY